MSRIVPGVAVDVGTTTVVLHLVDIVSGKKLATLSRVNEQARYGADVTSRIEYSMKNGHTVLTELICTQISSMLAEACEYAKINSQKIKRVSIAGNTVMQHLLADFSPDCMGTAPFTPHSLFGDNFPAWRDLGVSRKAQIYFTPAVSAFVGGDITAGLLAAGFEDINYPALFLDIGTNGEIVLKHNGTYYCCATAAGPAFEGAEIEMGMVAEDGAISRVKLSGDMRVMGFTVIGGGAPKGFCGSGLIDLLACLLRKGDVDESGRLLSGDKFHVYTDVSVMNSVRAQRSLSPSIGAPLSAPASAPYITAEDIRKLQLAKAAIAAGVDVLLHYAGIKESDVRLLSLAGGIGSFLDTANAAQIGLFGTTLLPVAYPVGNAAGDGAVLALLEKDALERLYDIRDKCEYIDLSANALFNDRFIERMAF
ncbi:MAG: ASKHA domain-containing protein [Oscillospiraceae bacterium]|nr:ASKHA domain-containing protein [Oscillospiraceae bacterium]